MFGPFISVWATINIWATINVWASDSAEVIRKNSNQLALGSGSEAPGTMGLRWKGSNFRRNIFQERLWKNAEFFEGSDAWFASTSWNALI